MWYFPFSSVLLNHKLNCIRSSDMQIIPLKIHPLSSRDLWGVIPAVIRASGVHLLLALTEVTRLNRHWCFLPLTPPWNLFADCSIFESLKWHLQLNCHPHFPLFRSEWLQTGEKKATHAQAHMHMLAQTKLVQRKSNNEVQPRKAGVKINIWGIIASARLSFKWACFAWNPKMSWKRQSRLLC